VKKDGLSEEIASKVREQQHRDRETALRGKTILIAQMLKPVRSCDPKSLLRYELDQTGDPRTRLRRRRWQVFVRTACHGCPLSRTHRSAGAPVIPESPKPEGLRTIEGPRNTSRWEDLIRGSSTVLSPPGRRRAR